MSKKIRFALIGAGRIAQSYIEAMRVSDNAELSAVCDSNPASLAASAAQGGCPGFLSHTELLSKAKIDAAVICTPPTTHPGIAIDCFRAGAHVLCEKPLSVDTQSAWTMINASKESGVLMTMASKFRFVQDVIEARRLVTTGAIGDVILFENAFTGRVDMANRWNSDPAISGGGVLIDNGTHSLDIARYILGPLVSVQAVEGRRSQGLVVEDTVCVFAKALTGVMAKIDLSWSIQKPQESYIDIFGSQGVISVGWKQSRYKRLEEKDWTVFGAGYDKVGAFRGQLDNFARAIRGEEPLVIGPMDGLASVEAVEAAYMSLAQSHWISVRGRRLPGEPEAAGKQDAA